MELFKIENKKIRKLNNNIIMCNELGNISLFVYTTKIIYFYPFVNTFEVKKYKIFLFRKILNKII